MALSEGAAAEGAALSRLLKASARAVMLPSSVPLVPGRTLPGLFLGRPYSSEPLLMLLDRGAYAQQH